MNATSRLQSAHTPSYNTTGPGGGWRVTGTWRLYQ
jgi:hypothetical protein